MKAQRTAPRSSIYIAVIACLLVAAVPLRAQRTVKPKPSRAQSTFNAKTWRAPDGSVLPYRLFVPPRYDARQHYPLVLWLHGGGGRGRDNVKQITEGNSIGASVWTTEANQASYPSIVVAPQCPEGEMWTTIGENVRSTVHLRRVMALLDVLQRTYSIDRRRIYVAGQSMGGFATWALLAEYPNRFAAAIPICGGGDESQAARLASVPIWAFHGDLDRAVSVDRSRRMIAAVRRAGGTPRYTEYKNVDHVVWNLAFNDRRLIPWLFARKLPPPR